LERLRCEVIDPHVQAHEGRIFKATGDGLLIEFSSFILARSPFDDGPLLSPAAASSDHAGSRIDDNAGRVIGPHTVLESRNTSVVLDPRYFLRVTPI
jgi:class 3 adenylate cyclase